MYSEFNLDIDIDNNRKITDIKSKYRIKILPPFELSISFYEYSKNFYDAAHTIASYLLETGKPNIGQLDSYFFVMAFLYRHSIELILKSIAFRNIHDQCRRVEYVKRTRHNLTALFEEAMKLEICSRDAEEIGWLKEYLSNLAKIDKESDSFRYPFNISKTKVDCFEKTHYSIKRVFEKQTHIDMILFANKLETTYEVLNHWFMGSNDASNGWKKLIPVFIENGWDYYSQAVVGYEYKKNDFYPYLKAYTETAGYIRSIMNDSFDKGCVAKSTGLFMPMCYLYRNAVELCVKSVWIEDVRLDFQYRCKKLEQKKHSIIGLWNLVRSWIKDFYGEEPNEKQYLDDITIICQNLQDFDGTASRFRYPCTKKMERYFHSEKIMDFMNVAEFMESLVHAIYNIGIELGVRKEYIDEMEAEVYI